MNKSDDVAQLKKEIENLKQQIRVLKQEATELNFNDFVKWANGFMLFEIGCGRSLNEIMWVICQQAAANKVWGGQKTT